MVTVSANVWANESIFKGINLNVMLAYSHTNDKLFNNFSAKQIYSAHHFVVERYFLFFLYIQNIPYKCKVNSISIYTNNSAPHRSASLLFIRSTCAFLHLYGFQNSFILFFFYLLPAVMHDFALYYYYYLDSKALWITEKSEILGRLYTFEKQCVWRYFDVWNFF